MTGCPVAVRLPETSQPLLPEVPGPSAANSPTASAPSRRATSSRHSLAGKPANRMCVASQTARGVHGSQRPGARPVAANSGARLREPRPGERRPGERRASSARPSLTPSTYARTQAAVSGSRPSRAAEHRRAVSSSRACRANRSQARASAPGNAAEVPCDLCRSISICQARSTAALRPCAKASSRALPARRCGIPQASRRVSMTPPLIGLGEPNLHGRWAGTTDRDPGGRARASGAIIGVWT